jgi:all-trans-retinol dehydrogenase (NAD+)
MPAFIKTFLARDLSPADTFTSRLLAPESVAEAIVDQILMGESGYVGIPRTPNILGWQLRSLPAWIQNPFRDRLERFMRRPKQKNPWLD